MHILSLILWTPVVGALAILALPARQIRLIRAAALGSSAAVLMLTIWLLCQFDTSSSAIQFAESRLWNAELGSYYALGVDGFSLPMVVLSALLCLVAVLASESVIARVKGYHFWLLALEFGMIGVFLAQDWALFYVFWELTLIPLFFLIDQWGGERKHTASLNFVLYTMGGSVFMLVSLLMIFTASSEHSTTMESMLATARSLPREQQIWIFLGFLIGFGAKMPVFPIHGWLPLAHVEAPSPVSILLSGALLKMGAYGLLKATGMLPEAAQALQPLLAGLALVSLVYGALLAWRQTDLKAMIAYSSISHMGVVLIGIAALNQAGLLGAVLQMTAHGLIAGALFLLIGLLYERTHTREITDYSSLVQVTPRFAFFTTLALLASMGLPGSAGFVAELHAIIGGFQSFGWIMLFASVGVLIGASYAIRTAARLFTGPMRPEMQNVHDLRSHELVAAGVLAAGIMALGLMPGPMVSLTDASVNQLSMVFNDKNY
ncbi:complex I subunit 4 family protein [Methylocaldum szegediense]|uniref:complex I subunit 4 family protein n=1 Tax=Methylocaldum szegediense TaxID=73780 RepID=UPI00041D35D0|nr:NADH-quinone oxidoreductase subunit M [Methylocaldum szegediense]